MNRIKFKIMNLTVSVLHRIGFFFVRRDFFLSLRIAKYCQKKAFNLIQEMEFTQYKITHEKTQSRKSL